MKQKDKQLLIALTDPSDGVRSAAAISLGSSSNDAQAVKGLAEMLTRRYEPVRDSAADALMVIGNRTAVNEIVRCLSHPQAAVRFAVVSAVVKYLERAARSDLLSGTFGGWFNVRESSDGLTLGPSISVITEALITRLKTDSSRRIREAALEALQRLTKIFIDLRSARETTMKRARRGDYGGMDDDDGWGGPEEVQVEMKPTGVERNTELALQQAAENKPEPRYADVTLHTIDDRSRQRSAHSYDHPLRVGENYELEVTVRVHPEGVPFSGPARPSIYEPRQKHDVTIWVTLESDGFDVQNTTQTLTLPPKGDSTSAVFRVTPLQQFAGQLASARIRLYYHFNLMEELIVQAKVIGKFEKQSPRLSAPAISLDRTLEREYVDFDDIEPREMHINIGRRGTQFELLFTFYNEEKQTVELTAPIALQATDLEDKLLTVRNLLYDIAMSETFTKGLDGDEDEFIVTIRRLARAGQELWTTLFKREINSPLYKVGQWLEEHPLKQDAIIQVSIASDAAEFIFPWAIIYDRQLPAEDYLLPDLDGFWGLKYSLEQLTHNTRLAADDVQRIDGALKLIFVVWERFRNSQLQTEMLKEFQSESKGKLAVFNPPVNDAKVALDLLREGDAQIFYFYTHGHTRLREADVRPETDLDQFIKRYESLDAESPLRATYKLLYDTIKQGKFEPARSWIEPTYGKLYLDQLYASIDETFLSEPLVILNMCESAQVTPSLVDSFIHFFLDRGALSVLGTECPMTIEFAHPFAEKFLHDLLAGSQAGQALLNARRHFMKINNPLGLAYTLFGSATFRFEPPVLQSEIRPKENK